MIPLTNHAAATLSLAVSNLPSLCRFSESCQLQSFLTLHPACSLLVGALEGGEQTSSEVKSGVCARLSKLNTKRCEEILFFLIFHFHFRAGSDCRTAQSVLPNWRHHPRLPHTQAAQDGEGQTSAANHCGEIRISIESIVWGFESLQKYINVLPSGHAGIHQFLPQRSFAEKSRLHGTRLLPAGAGQGPGMAAQLASMNSRGPADVSCVLMCASLFFTASRSPLQHPRHLLWNASGRAIRNAAARPGAEGRAEAARDRKSASPKSRKCLTAVLWWTVPVTKCVNCAGENQRGQGEGDSVRCHPEVSGQEEAVR